MLREISKELTLEGQFKAQVLVNSVSQMTPEQMRESLLHCAKLLVFMEKVNEDLMHNCQVLWNELQQQKAEE